MNADDYYDDSAGELIDANLTARRRQNLLQTFWPDAQRIDDLEFYRPADWDPSLAPAEVRGAWPHGND